MPSQRLSRSVALFRFTPMTGRIGAGRIATASPPRPAGDRRPTGDPPSRGRRKSGSVFPHSSSPRAARSPPATRTKKTLCFASTRHAASCSGNISYPSDLGDKFLRRRHHGHADLRWRPLYWLSRWGDTVLLRRGRRENRLVEKRAEGNGRADPDWGFTGAPLVHGDCCAQCRRRRPGARQRRPGQIVWQSATKDCRLFHAAAGAARWQCYALGSRLRALLRGGDPQNGKEAWRIRWLTQYGVNAADPIVDGDRMFHLHRLRQRRRRSSNSAARAGAVWKTKAFARKSMPRCFTDGHLYGVDGDTTEKASLKCLDSPRARKVEAQPGFGSGGVIVADGKLIALSGTGN